MRVPIELFGIARARAGVAEVTVEAETLRDALRALELEHPVLAESILRDGDTSPGWLVSLNGAEFLADPETRLPEGARLLLVSAQAGG